MPNTGQLMGPDWPVPAQTLRADSSFVGFQCRRQL
jgi:hypothetical protein